MDKKTKKQMILDSIDPIQYLYPDLEKVMINDLDNPDYLIVCTDEYFQSMKKHLDIEPSVEKELDEHYAQTTKKSKKRMQ